MKIKILKDHKYMGISEVVGKTLEATQDDKRFYVLGSELIKAGAVEDWFNENYNYSFEKASGYTKVVDLKSMLKNGYRVKFRKGDMKIVLTNIDTIEGNKDFVFSSNDGSYICCDRYNDDLTHVDGNNQFDIVEIYKYKSLIGLLNENSIGELIYKESYKKEMTINEIEKELGYEIKIVK